MAIPWHGSPSISKGANDQAQCGVGEYREFGFGGRESKVAEPKRFLGKKGNEVYQWFVQLRLVFRSKPQTYNSDEDKVAYALSYIIGAA